MSTESGAVVFCPDCGRILDPPATGMSSSKCRSSPASSRTLLWKRPPSDDHEHPERGPLDAQSCFNAPRAPAGVAVERADGRFLWARRRLLRADQNSTLRRCCRKTMTGTKTFVQQLRSSAQNASMGLPSTRRCKCARQMRARPSSTSA